MIARAVNAAADVIHRAQVNGKQTAMGLAIALDSAQLLMSPEVAEELKRLRARVADLEAGLPAMQEALFKALDRVSELEAERHSTNEALDDAVQELRLREDGVYPQGSAQRVQQRQHDDPARCLKVHPFSPRDGWRMVCANCDHGKDASCHLDGGA